MGYERVSEIGLKYLRQGLNFKFFKKEALHNEKSCIKVNKLRRRESEIIVK
jgi:hypothetical protein